MTQDTDPTDDASATNDHPGVPDLDAMFEAVGHASPPELPSDSDGEKEGVPFSAPWQARAFGLAVAATDDEDDWTAFHDRFVERLNATDPETLQDDVEATYFERWLDALEAKLREQGVVTAEELERRAEEFSEGERDASEFVVEASVAAPVEASVEASVAGSDEGPTDYSETSQ